MRSEKIITIANPGRDNGKAFVITEMSARAAHAWATRALFAILNAGFEIPDDLMDTGLAGIATLGVSTLGKVPHELAAPLLDELFTCVVVIPDPSRPQVRLCDLDNHVEEIATLFMLQKEVLTMHIQPFMNGVNQTSALTPAAAPRVD